jgi:hypothetical protein
MKKLENNKKFQVGDVIVDTIGHKTGKILDFPQWSFITEESPLNQSNSYYINWVNIGYDLDVEYDEELRLDEWVDAFCEKVEYSSF